MAGAPLHKTLVYLRRLAAPGEPGALSDAELLERFIRTRDEAAFEVLVWRHGALVHGVCRRVLRHLHDAEDAFQAAFLTLARKAHTVGKHHSLSSWLYKVAYRIALAARARAARDRAEEAPAELPAAPSADDLLWRDLRPVLDEEVGRLPQKYREPVLLCDLQGLTHEEAAQQLGCPPGTLSVRLMRARERLRVTLTRRGLAPCGGLLATALAERASAALGTAQVAATVKAALAFAAGAGQAVLATPAATLARGALHTMLMTRLRNATLVLAASLLVALAGVLALQAANPDPQQAPRPQPVVKPAQRPQPASADVAAAVEGNTAFALDLYGRLRAQKGNLFLSPYSLSTALAMPYAGARGDTAAQMAKTLHFTLGQEKLHPALAELTARLRGGKKRGYELKVANALWGQQGHGFLPEFLKRNRALYGAELREVDFARASEPARRAINTWAEKETEGTIKELLQPDDLDLYTRLVLTNAIYFKSAWETPFKKAATQKRPFRGPGDARTVVPMMSEEAEFRFFEDDKLKGVELPYKGRELSLIVLLPTKADGLGELEKQLTTANLKQWLGRLKNALVWVCLPRFEITTTVRLKGVLSEMGMPLAFHPRAADFSGMTGKRELHLQAAVHKAFVRVDETGTEAASASVVFGGAGGIHPIFIADHPFLFLIRDNRTDSVLFLGRVVEPR